MHRKPIHKKKIIPGLTLILFVILMVSLSPVQPTKAADGLPRNTADHASFGLSHSDDTTHGSAVRRSISDSTLHGAGSSSKLSANTLVATTKTYTITDIGVPGNVSEAYAINNNGQVVGRTGDRAFIWYNGGITDLGTLGGNHAVAFGINDAGQVVGTSVLRDTFWNHAFLWQPNTGMTDLSTLDANQESVAYAINNNGKIAGYSPVIVFWYTGPCIGRWALPRAFLASTSTDMTQIGVLPNADDCIPTSYAFGINDNGYVVGMSTANRNETHAFLWRGFDMLDLGTFGGKYSQANAIGNNGQVVGSASFPSPPNDYTVIEHAFLWDPFTGKHDLLTLAGDSNSGAFGLNVHGQVVGASYSDQARRAFFWQPGLGMVDLNRLIPKGSGWTLETARDINDSGQIVGVGTHNGQTRAFLLTPMDDTSLYQITGQVVDQNNNPIAGVTISDDAGDSTITDSAGAYRIGNVVGDMYTLMPARNGFAFTPTTRTVTLPPDADGQNFTAVAYPISGRVTDRNNNPLADVTIADDAGHTTTTGADGSYMLPNLAPGSYTLTPTKSTYVFSPTTRLVTLPPEATKQDFSAQYHYELIGLEVTQGIQNWNNAVVLIQGKTTFVRAHVQTKAGTIHNLTAELIGRQNGVELPGSPLRSINPIDVLEGPYPLKGPNRLELNDSFLFALPTSWLSGTVELEFSRANDDVVCHAGIRTDCKVDVSFTPSPAIDVRLIGISWRDDGITGAQHTPTLRDKLKASREIAATFPVPQVHVEQPTDIVTPFGQPSTLLGFAVLNLRLEKLRLFDGCITSACKWYYLGLLVDPQGASVVGAARVPSNVAVAYVNDQHTVSHELGHAAGRHHTSCTPDPDDEREPDLHYPYQHGYISDDFYGDDAFYGFDIRLIPNQATNSPVYSPNTGDLMSYCSPKWPSDYTYTGIRNQLVSRYGTSAVTSGGASEQSARVAVSPGTDAIVVGGLISPTLDTAEIQSLDTIAAPASLSLPESGSYALQFEDKHGHVLASYSFAPAPSAEGSVTPFALLLPWNTRATRVSLLHNSQVLATRSASAHPPSITITSPNGGEALSGAGATLSWAATDPDGDALTYTIQYSADAGATWRTLATDWLSSIYDLDLDALPGTDQGLLRVLVSDGFYTAQDQSDAVFGVDRHAPQVSIEAPQEDDVYVYGQTIILDGSAYDAEDGQLGDAALSWSSNLNGDLGTGRTLMIDASALVDGSQTITLSARDSDGQTSSTNIRIFVYETRPRLPADLSVAPGALSFVVPSGSGQTAQQVLAIRNAGDGDLSWSAVADQSWIRVGSSSGAAPSNVAVSADPTGLAPGEYTGTIAITADGIAGSPQAIDVTLDVVAPADASVPQIIPTLTGVRGANGWYKSSVVVTWSVNDAESGIAASHACEATTLKQETAGTTLTCSATNGAGMANAVSVTVKIDKNRPNIAIISPQATSYDHTRTVSISWTATDALAGVASASATLDGARVTNGQVLDLFRLGLGAHTLVVTATDAAGNSASRSITFTNRTARVYLPIVRR